MRAQPVSHDSRSSYCNGAIGFVQFSAQHVTRVTQGTSSLVINEPPAITTLFLVTISTKSVDWKDCYEEPLAMVAQLIHNSSEWHIFCSPTTVPSMQHNTSGLVSPTRTFL